MWLHKEKDFSKTLDRLRDESFIIKPCVIAGDNCFLINPAHMGVEWHSNNMIYRSSIWTEDGQPVSLSWKKFFNWDEKSGSIAPKPTNFDECNFMNKEDGSTLIVSVYKGEVIIRTRGTWDASHLDNGHEIEFLKKKYADFFNSFKDTPKNLTEPWSWIFEWETPNNKIVIDYGDEPKLVFTGCMDHKDYSYTNNKVLDYMADFLLLERPIRYTFKDFEDMEEVIKSTKGIEGLCCYFNNDQDIKKLKTSEYLLLHSVKFKLGYKALIDMIVEENVSLNEFKAFIENKYDYEGLTFIENLIDNIYRVSDHLISVISYYYDDITYKMTDPSDRKMFAEFVMGEAKIFSGYLFKIHSSTDSDVKEVIFKNENTLRKFKSDILLELT